MLRTGTEMCFGSVVKKKKKNIGPSIHTVKEHPNLEKLKIVQFSCNIFIQISILN